MRPQDTDLANPQRAPKARTGSFLFLSTSHVSAACLEKMNNVQWGARIHERNHNPDDPIAPTIGGPYAEYGWFLYAQEEGHDEINFEFEGLGSVFAYARKHGYDWVLLDCDEDPVDDLTVYEHI